MLSTWKGWRVAVRLAAVLSAVGGTVLLAGCSTGSIVPGLGGSGGLGTPGTGTGNPDGAMVFTLRGVNTGNFEASEMRTQSSFLGFTIQAIQESGSATSRLTRVATVRFPGLPVAGRTYLLTPHEDGDGSPEEEHAILQYSEQRTNPDQLRVWAANKGTIRVSHVTSDIIEGSFQATLEPATAAATGTLTISGGEYRVKYQAPAP